MNPLSGVFFHWLGGLASGSFYVPFRGVRRWSWETAWLVAGIFSWILAPWFFALLLTKNVGTVIQGAPTEVLAKTYLCGVCWGFGGLTFGLTMRYLGMSLGMAIALGYCAVVGTLVPPIVDGSFVRSVWQPAHGKVILLGVLVCLLGIAIAGRAGVEKEKSMTPEEKRTTVKEFNFKKGLLIATFSGVMSAFFAFGFKASEEIAALTRAQGTAAHWAGLPCLIVILAGGFTTNFLWCLLLNYRNRTGYQYFSSAPRENSPPVDNVAGGGEDAPVSADPANGLSDPAPVPLPRNYLFAAMAGVVWYFQFFFYQIGESQMGDFKFSSWTLHMASIIIFSSLWGLALHEWKGSTPKARKLLFLGLAVLVFSTFIVGYGNFLGGQAKGH